MSYKVCIPTAGTGSRLNELTSHINKSLVSVANRPVLTHLVDQFPEDVEFVLPLGYKGELVREFVEHAYPDRVFHFAEVFPYEGHGSGLGLSLLACKKFLQEPFVFCSCDTLVDERIPAPDHDWMGYAELNETEQYRTLQVADGQVVDLCEKNAVGHNLKPYIGLAGINDFLSFWEYMQRGGEDAIDIGESFAFKSLLKTNKVRAYRFTWLDTGNPQALERAREIKKEENSPNILDKANEAIWFVGDRVVKFSTDKDFIRNRVARISEIGDFTPHIVKSTEHMYQYPMVKGDVLSSVITRPLFSSFLSTSKKFWKKEDLSTAQYDEFKKGCLKFYKNKTEERVKLFYQNFDQIDAQETINNRPMPLLSELLEQIDWDWLAQGAPGRFHGDFHFENILWSESDDRFVFLDWRQEFAGSISVGDIYYDLAKLLHGMIVSHELIVENLFSVSWQGERIQYDLMRRQVLVDCERDYKTWLINEGYDVKKVWMLTALIYLNIAALHHYPYSLLLYALGKDMLEQIIFQESGL